MTVTVHTAPGLFTHKHLIGRDITTSNDLTAAEASRVLDALKKDVTP